MLDISISATDTERWKYLRDLRKVQKFLGSSCVVAFDAHGVINKFYILKITSRLFMNRLSQIRSIMRQHGLEMISALIIGSLLDADHFIAAGSSSLKAATSLQSRPFGHNLFFIFTVSTVIFFLLPRRLSLLFFTSTFSHLTRDALRRGYTLCPWSSLSSSSISYPMHLIMLACLPFLPSFLLRKYPYYWDRKTFSVCFKDTMRSKSLIPISDGVNEVV